MAGGEEQTTTTSLPATRTATDQLLRATAVLAAATGVDVAGMHPVAGVPESPSANTIVEWEGGRAEVDDSTGVVYAAAMEQPAASPFLQFMSEDRLRYDALRLVRDLGWSDGTLTGLGFEQREPAALVEGTGLYTITWSQYDAGGGLQDGSIVLKLEGRTGRLVRFSAWLGADAPDLAGAISESDALLIAQSEIYLRSDSRKLSVDGDGSLILLNRAVTEELKVVSESKIVDDKPRLCWVITITGSVGTKLVDGVASADIVGGTVHIDAKSGDVLWYEAYKESEPAGAGSLDLLGPRLS